MEGLDGAKDIVFSVDGNHAYITGSVDNAVTGMEKRKYRSVEHGGMLKDGIGGVDGLEGASKTTLVDQSMPMSLGMTTMQLVGMIETRVRSVELWRSFERRTEWC